MFSMGIGVEPKLTATSMTMSNNMLKLSSTSGVEREKNISLRLGFDFVSDKLLTSYSSATVSGFHRLPYSACSFDTGHPMNTKGTIIQV